MIEVCLHIGVRTKGNKVCGEKNESVFCGWESDYFVLVAESRAILYSRSVIATFVCGDRHSKVVTRALN